MVVLKRLTAVLLLTILTAMPVYADDEMGKKITDKDYVVLEVDWELNRIYFLPGEPDEGFKLTGTGKTKSITFTRNDIERWDEIQGCYFLLKDPKEKSYYIDYSSKAKEE